jgi:O-methyltransferase
MNRSGSRVRAAVRQGLNRVLRPAGSRIVTGQEWRGLTAGKELLVDQLVDLFEALVLPDLEPRQGRRELLHRLIGTEIPEAMYLLDSLRQSLAGPGDVCEMGVAQGATSALIANEIATTDRTLWLYDSFEGLSAPTTEDVLLDDVLGLGSMDSYAGSMAVGAELVQGRLRELDFPPARTRIVKGFIEPDLPAERLPDQVAFAYLDFDLYEPILTGLRLLHPRCRPGSVLMVDDFGFLSAGVEAAVREFLAEHGDLYSPWEAPPHAGHFCVLRRGPSISSSRGD